MADVFRQGRKSVHRAIVSGDPDDPMRPNGCNLDSGGAWTPVAPPGHRCSVCFAGDDGADQQAAPAPRGSRPRTPALALASGALALAFLGGVWASPDQRPMTSLQTFQASTTSAYVPSTGPTFVAASATAGIPSQTPAPTPIIVSTPTTVPDIHLLQPIIVFYPQPKPDSGSTFSPPPTPAPTACPHPGVHLGLKPCRWPHA